MSDKEDATCRYSFVATGLGWVGILASPRGIRRLTLPQAIPAMAYAYLEMSERDISPEPASEMSLNIEWRLEQYFLGQETAFHDVLDVAGIGQPTPIDPPYAWNALGHRHDGGLGFAMIGADHNVAIH